MKQLPNNFTTPEQSKRLLELGLPANSADCFLNGSTVIVLNGKSFQESYDEDLYFARLHLVEYPKYVPCWSVGRLIEIYGRCDKHEFNQGDLTVNARIHKNITDYLISRFILAVGVSELDFSKLEE